MGGAEPRSLPLLICPSRAVVSPNADGGAPLQPHKPLCSLTSQPSGESYCSPRRPPPAGAGRAEGAAPPGPLSSRAPCFPGPGRARGVPPSLALAPLGWPPGDAAFPGAPARQLPAGPGALTPRRGPKGRRVERTRAPRPSPQAARLPLQRLPRGEGAGGAPGAARQTYPGSAPRRSPPRVAAAPPRPQLLGRRGGERAFPPHRPPQPGSRAPPPTWISSWRWCSAPLSTCRRPPSSTGGELAPGRPPRRLLSHANPLGPRGPL